MIVLWEYFSKLIIWITGALFRLILIGFFIGILIKYTPVGQRIRLAGDKYYEMTGKSFSINEIKANIDLQTKEALDNIDGLSSLFSK